MNKKFAKKVVATGLAVGIGASTFLGLTGCAQNQTYSANEQQNYLTLIEDQKQEIEDQKNALASQGQTIEDQQQSLAEQKQMIEDLINEVASLKEELNNKADKQDVPQQKSYDEAIAELNQKLAQLEEVTAKAEDLESLSQSLNSVDENTKAQTSQLLEEISSIAGDVKNLENSIGNSSDGASEISDKAQNQINKLKAYQALDNTFSTYVSAQYFHGDGTSSKLVISPNGDFIQNEYSSTYKNLSTTYQENGMVYKKDNQTNKQTVNQRGEFVISQFYEMISSGETFVANKDNSISIKDSEGNGMHLVLNSQDTVEVLSFKEEGLSNPSGINFQQIDASTWNQEKYQTTTALSVYSNYNNLMEAIDKTFSKDYLQMDANIKYSGDLEEFGYSKSKDEQGKIIASQNAVAEYVVNAYTDDSWWKGYSVFENGKGYIVEQDSEGQLSSYEEDTDVGYNMNALGESLKYSLTDGEVELDFADGVYTVDYQGEYNSEFDTEKYGTNVAISVNNSNEIEGIQIVQYRENTGKNLAVQTETNYQISEMDKETFDSAMDAIKQKMSELAEEKDKTSSNSL